MPVALSRPTRAVQLEPESHMIVSIKIIQRIPYAKLRYMDLEKDLKDVGSQHAEKFNRTIRPFTRSLNMYSAPLRIICSGELFRDHEH